MIAFSCPKCGSGLTRADNETGQRTTCPSCGQRLQIPQPPAPDDDLMLGQLDVEPRRKYRQRPEQSWLGFIGLAFAVLCLLSWIGFGMASNNYYRTIREHEKLKLSPTERVYLQHLKEIDDMRGYTAIGGAVFALLAVVLASAVFVQANKSKVLSLVTYAICLVGLLIVVIGR